MRSLKKLLFFAFVAMLPTLSTDESAANQVYFDSPLLMIEAQVGTQSGQFGISFSPEGGGWYYPTDFTIDPSGSIWVLDSRNDRVQKFDQNGQFIFAVTLPQHYKSIKDKPFGDFLFRVDRDGNFYQMEIILPGSQDEHLSWNYPPSSSVTFLRIWKWNRTK